MFKLSSATDTFALPVTVPIPNEKGVIVKAKLHLTCKRLSREEVVALWEAAKPVFPKIAAPANAGAEEPPVEATEPAKERKQITDDEVINQVVVGFGDDVVDDNNVPLPWTAENKAAVFAVHPLTECAVAAFFDYYMKAGRKN